MNRLVRLFFTLAKNNSGHWDGIESAVREADLPALLRELDWLRPDALHVCRPRSYPDFRRLAKDGRLRPVEPRMCGWGIAYDGLCFTQPVREEKGAGRGCSLSRILISDAPEKYYLSTEQVEKLLFCARTDTSGMRVLTETDSGGADKEAA